MYYVRLDGMALPVAPERIEWKYNTDNEKTRLMSVGEINILRPVGLTEFSFEAMLPAVKYHFAYYDGGRFRPPVYYIERFKSIIEQSRAVRFEVLRTGYNGEFLFDNSLNVTIEGLTIIESAGQGLDVTARISLKQYKEYGTVKYILREDGALAQGAERSGKKETPSSSPKLYTIKKGDTLWAVCRREYGDGAKYKDVAEENGIVNPNLIYPGQVIRLK